MLLLRQPLQRATQLEFSRHLSGSNLGNRVTAIMAATEHVPPTAHGRMELDRQMFTHKLSVPALRVARQRCNELMRLLRGHTLDRPKLRCIVQDGTASDSLHRLLLLSDTLDSNNLPEVVLEAAKAENCEITSHEVAIDYTHLNADQVLKRVLPAGVDAPASFETIGHIIHLNLREEQLPYKHIIGQVLLDKNPHVKTVVNKVGSIDNEFRVFTMELLAGEDRTETEVVQHGLRFKLDFAQVYWNSRLETEHKRLVAHYFQRGQVVVDIMAGIGPFAIPAAAHGACKVYANDLNPSSARYMAINVRLNRVGSLVHVFNMDGRAFVRLLCDAPPMQHKQHGQQQQEAEPQAQQQDGQAESTGRHVSNPESSTAGPASDEVGIGNGTAAQAGASDASLRQGVASTSDSRTILTGTGTGSGVLPAVPEGVSVPPGGLVFQHAVMNLPASAVEFLDAFNGAFDPATWKGRLPLVHVYTFKTAAMTEQDVIDRVEFFLGGPLEEPPTVHHVRDVAPNKIMLCVTFRVPEAVAFNGRQGAGQGEQEGAEAASKRQKV